MAETPGTVSRILWHFTGGPKWNELRRRQGKRRKPPEEAYEALTGILKSRTLRLGTYKEIIRVRLPYFRRFDRRTSKVVIDVNVMKELISAPICSVADIPIAHLPYHAKRYGKFAVGFHRDAAIRHGFNPVFYTLVGTSVLRSLYEGFAQIGHADLTRIEDSVEEIADATCKDGHEINADARGSQLLLKLEIGDLERYVDAAREGYEEFLAYVKTFDRNEFAEIYTEREWRATTPFRFSLKNVAMIVLPRKDGNNQFFDRFIADSRRDVRLPRSIPIVPWDDLLEY